MSAANIQNKPNILAPSMPVELYNEAVSLFKVPSTKYNETSMIMFIIDQIRKYDNEITWHVDNYNNLIVTKGKAETYPCFVSHLDTVHVYPNGFNVMYIDEENRRYIIAEDDNGKSVGIGGDDKCGIFVCMQLLKKLKYVKIVFFSKEETGGTGSSNIQLAYFKDCRFIASVDRWNGHDFVMTYNCAASVSRKFKQAVKPLLQRYGYSNADGMFTDSFNLMARGVGVACVNISCGYYSHHSDDEYVDLNELFHALLLCIELSDIIKIPYPYTYITPTYKSSAVPINGKFGGRNHFHNDRWWDDRVQTPSHVKTCKDCGLELVTGEHEFCNYCKPYYDTQKRLGNNIDYSTKRYCHHCGVELNEHESKICIYCTDDLPTPRTPVYYT